MTYCKLPIFEQYLYIFLLTFVDYLIARIFWKR